MTDDWRRKATSASYPANRARRTEPARIRTNATKAPPRPTRPDFVEPRASQRPSLIDAQVVYSWAQVAHNGGLRESIARRISALQTIREGRRYAHVEADGVLLPTINGSRGRSRGAIAARAEAVRGLRSLGRAWGSSALLCGKQALVVHVIRIAPRLLDQHDNLAASAKALIDGIADGLGINDRDPRVEWVVSQEKGEAAVRVEFFLWRWP